MATYKKRGYKKSIISKVEGLSEESTTAEVFDKLDSSASKTEQFVAKYQNFIIGFIGFIALTILSYLAYINFIYEPMEREAVSELSQAQYYFDIALNGENSDSLYYRALNGGEGKYGFLDIIENYEGTSAAKLATYSAGMAYLNVKDYEKAIFYLDQFDSDDILLSALSKGAIGDAFAEIGQIDEAYEYYVLAFEASENSFTTPKYLYKAAMTANSNDQKNLALSYLKRIKEDFPDAVEANLVDVQIGRLENID
ncbi:MAG: hypothetical protein VX325_06990 [Bacteroidota bacterium]|nr:hypothetical protein [Bacteroidota bacterium]